MLGELILRIFSTNQMSLDIKYKSKYLFNEKFYNPCANYLIIES